ncbi:MAG: class I SAM-dependent methyltransferase, partial [Actinobacteria bacterium]|nr:class I SAM-dependent methyltransferase [Actinomycetota bacterium]
LIIKFLGFKKRLGIGSVSSLVMYDRVVFPVSRILDRLGFRFLFGKNLILKAKKTT